MKLILCPECNTIMEKDKRTYICPGCNNTMTTEEYKNFLSFKKQKDERDKKLLAIKNKKIEEAEANKEFIHPLTYGNSKIKVDPIEALNLIKKLLISDHITKEEKENLKIMAHIFINNHNCTICSKSNSECDMTGIWHICEITNNYISHNSDYYIDLPICPKDCPVKNYKL